METKSIYQKLLEVQQEVAPIKKTESNPFFGSKYFDVNAILAALKPILNKHGLVLIQGFGYNEGKNILNTVLIDSESGVKVETSVILPEVQDPQKFGSAVTYYRRYALQSLFALEAQDDDGNSAAEVVNRNPVKMTPYQKKAEQRRDPKFQAIKNDTDNDFGQEPIIQL